MTVQLIDFGLAVDLPNGQQFLEEKVLCGTPNYLAPEVVQNKTFSQKSDIWALGIVAYVLGFGIIPYDGKTVDEVLQNIKQKPIDYPANKASAQLEKFIRFILRENPELRPSLSDIMRHQFLSNLHLIPEKMPKTSLFLVPTTTFLNTIKKDNQYFNSSAKFAQLLEKQQTFTPPQIEIEEIQDEFPQNQKEENIQQIEKMEIIPNKEEICSLSLKNMNRQRQTEFLEKNSDQTKQNQIEPVISNSSELVTSSTRKRRQTDNLGNEDPLDLVPLNITKTEESICIEFSNQISATLNLYDFNFKFTISYKDQKDKTKKYLVARTEINKFLARAPLMLRLICHYIIRLRLQLEYMSDRVNFLLENSLASTASCAQIQDKFSIRSSKNIKILIVQKLHHQPKLQQIVNLEVLAEGAVEGLVQDLNENNFLLIIKQIVLRQNHVHRYFVKSIAAK